MNNNLINSLIIVGSGPAALTASIYASRAKIDHIIITGETKGGQLINSLDIENFPGNKLISGIDLMLQIEDHAKSFGSLLVSDTITKVDFSKQPFTLVGNNQSYKAKSIIIATGSNPKYLGLENEEQLIGKGISYCATCDGNFFKNQHVAVVGGGNTAIEDSLYLSNIASKVTIIHRRNELRGEKILQERLLGNNKIEVLWNTTISSLKSNNKSLHAIKIYNKLEKHYSELEVTALFVAIGNYPNTSFLGNQLQLDSHGHIVTHNKSTRTSVKGVFAAGDVQEPNYKQAIISAGTGALAALEVGKFLINYR